MGSNGELFEQLRKLRSSRTVIVGIGNTLKGDDGAGPLICEHLSAAGVSAELIDAGTVPENYIQPIIRKAPENLVIVDAMEFGASPGTVGIFRPEQLAATVISTHMLSPRLLVDMIKAEMEVEVYFVGIQPAQTGLGQPVSGQVKKAIERVRDLLVEVFPPAR